MEHARCAVFNYHLSDPAGPDLASSSTSIPILSTVSFESGSASIASASASPNRPSSMNGASNASHDLRVTCRLGARRNLPASSGNRRR